MTRIRLVAHRANLITEPAARTIFRRDLQQVTEPCKVLGFVGNAAETLRRSVERFGRHHLGADGGMGTNEGALVALDADRRIPNRHLEGDVAFFEA